VRLLLLPLGLIAIISAIGLVSREDGSATIMPAAVELVEIGRFEQPVHVTSPPGDRRLFVAEREGRISIVARGRRLPRPFLDVQREVSTEGLEEGFLSVAFAPDYAASGLFYVDFTDRRHRTVIREYRRSGDTNAADPTSARDVLVLPNATDHHHGGLLLFGPDRRLYIGQGDGGNSSPTNFPAQRLDNLHGKILRIDPRAGEEATYRVPDDNPLVGAPGRDEIWVYGLRNPWRFAFDPVTNALVIGDVGQLSVEEIDVAQRPGVNFGWSCYEGTAVYTPQGPPSCDDVVGPALEHFRVARPVHEDVESPTVTRGRPAIDVRFTPAEASCSIVVGVAVEDPALGDLLGRQLYADFCDPELRSFRLEGGKIVDERPLGVSVPNTSSFGTDAEGHVYVTSLAGPVYRLAPVG
jgi:hypothetical protein